MVLGFEMFWLFFIVLLSSGLHIHGQNCRNKCGEIEIKFPFGIDDECGDPLHRLNCDNDNLTISLQNYPVQVHAIEYDASRLIIDTTYISDKINQSTCNIPLDEHAYDVHNDSHGICFNTYGAPPDAMFKKFQVLYCLFQQGREFTPPQYPYGSATSCYTYSIKHQDSFAYDQAPLAQFGSVAFLFVEVPFIISDDKKRECRDCEQDETGTCGYTLEGNRFFCINGTVTGKKSKRAAIIGGVTAGCVAFLFILLGFTIHLGRRKPLIGNRNDNRMMKSKVTHNVDLIRVLPRTPRIFSYKELLNLTNNFGEKLGEGGFGMVYFGVLPDNTKVAVKRLQSANQGHKEFIAEVMTIGSIHHFNLVQLRGFCAEGDNRLLVYDYACNGSLDKWLFSSPSQMGQREESFNGCLSWEVRLRIALGTARALMYLHEECKERILHLDVKPQNILLDDKFNAKVCDFGMSKLMSRDESSVFTTMRGTRGYLAPEWLQSSITEKVDVYSYGVVLLELVSGLKCLDLGRIESSKWCLASWAMEKAQQGENLLKDLVDVSLLSGYENDKGTQEQTEQVVHIALSCIQESPAARPSMSKIVQMLEPFVVKDNRRLSDSSLSASLKTRKSEVFDCPEYSYILQILRS